MIQEGERHQEIVAQAIRFMAFRPATPAEIYKWKDKDGNVFYSDTPPPAGMDAETKKFKEGSPPTEKSKPEVSSPLPMGETVKEKRPYSSINVTMYMTSW